jgi:hypothetical protein
MFALCTEFSVQQLDFACDFKRSVIARVCLFSSHVA